MQPGTANPDHPFCSHPFNSISEAMDQIKEFHPSFNVNPHFAATRFLA